MISLGCFLLLLITLTYYTIIMDREVIALKGNIRFKLRFNTTHGGTNLFWRVIIDDTEYLATSLQCQVPTFSNASFDAKANSVKYHIAGECREFMIDEDGNAFFS